MEIRDEGVATKSNSAGSLAKKTAERDICVLHDARGGNHVLEFLTVLPGVADKFSMDYGVTD